MDSNLISINLPLRRRVFFLMDTAFLEDCFSLSTDPGTSLTDLDVVEATTCLRQAHAVLSQAKDKLEAQPTANGTTGVTDPSDDRVIFTLSTLMDLVQADPQGSSSGMCIASSARARQVWAVQLDALLYALEDSSDTRRLSNDTAEVVRKALCSLIGVFYSKGMAYYSRKETASLPLDEGSLMKSTEAFSGDDSGAKGGAIVRLTWSLASPVLEDVYKLLTS
ncbi:unnamed protein product [Phytomonas sp. EM1]|nr:unnamed protein product [Phytomonas sp. EM1]|eukprot:CCW63747.1 unnamed protein product [Phytomonas sp. isolate EM1]